MIAAAKAEVESARVIAEEAAKEAKARKDKAAVERDEAESKSKLAATLANAGVAPRLRVVPEGQ